MGKRRGFSYVCITLTGVDVFFMGLNPPDYFQTTASPEIQKQQWLPPRERRDNDTRQSPRRACMQREYVNILASDVSQSLNSRLPPRKNGVRKQSPTCHRVGNNSRGDMTSSAAGVMTPFLSKISAVTSISLILITLRRSQKGNVRFYLCAHSSHSADEAFFTFQFLVTYNI